MTKSWFTSICIIICTFSACTSDRISGSLSISPYFYIDLYSLNSGRRVLSDTSYNYNFELGVEQLPKGIYQVVFSWDRNIVKPQEMERFARQPELGTPKYFMSTTFWLDPREPSEYRLLLDRPYTQVDLEEILIVKDGSESVKMEVVSGGANNKIYNEYLKLVDRYRVKNQYQKDSLQQVATHYSDLQEFKEADRLNGLLATDWLANVKVELLQAEIDFMKKNIGSEVIPYIYQIQVNSREDFDRYNEVYKLFTHSVRRDLANLNKNQ